MSKVESLYVDRYKGKHRLLLIFSPDAVGPAFQSQMNLLETAQDDLKRQDVIVGTIIVQGADHIEGRQIDRASELGLREDLGINPDVFAVVLIDKDGEQLLHENDVTEPAVILRALQEGAAQTR